MRLEVANAAFHFIIGARKPLQIIGNLATTYWLSRNFDDGEVSHHEEDFW
jgi:hypothetical protein